MARRLGPSQSPVVPATMNKKLGETRAESAFNWGASCLLGAALIGADMLSICIIIVLLNNANYCDIIMLMQSAQLWLDKGRDKGRGKGRANGEYGLATTNTRGTCSEAFHHTLLLNES